MEEATIWMSKITSSEVKSWSDEKIAKLIEALDDAVMQTYDDILDDQES